MQSDYSEINIIAVHKIGNKANEEGVRLSNAIIEPSEDTKELLTHYFVSPFKSDEYFNFYHDINLEMNEVFSCVSKIFDSPDSLLEQSVHLAGHLYEQSTHPNIKCGEFYTVYFNEFNFNGETMEAIGLFKSENKDTFLKVYPSGESFCIESDKGVNINKLDKGCLIFNAEKENGYIVAVVDNTNKGLEAQYWIDNFLHVRQRKDEYYKTQNLLSMCKDFVTNELPQHFEVSKADQIDLLNKSVSFFKTNENFEMEEFTGEVIVQPEIIEKFNDYKSVYEEERDVELADSFNISGSAVKKQSRVYKSVIKLDKNFHIYVHGNRQLIEQGSDDKGKYYKVYYKEEL